MSSVSRFLNIFTITRSKNREFENKGDELCWKGVVVGTRLTLDNEDQV